MARATKKTTPSRRAVALHLGSSFADARDQVLLPWFESVALKALTAPLPVVVLTPSPNHSAFLRSQILEKNISLLGIKFLSPSRLREMLLRGTGLTISPRENLRLFLAIAADTLAAESTDDTETALIARSVARDPDLFLRALDQLNIAGWDFDEIEPPILRTLARRFHDLTRQCGFAMVRETDTAIAAQTTNTSPAFGHLLVTGFNGEHWPVWPLLRATVTTSTNAVIVLQAPREEARELDDTWVGTWEENFGAAQPISAVDETPASALRDLTSALESGRPTGTTALPNEHAQFVVGADSTQQARAVVALAAQFLRQPACRRVGILFPKRGTLARLVANYLEAAGIPHEDGIAHLAPSVFDVPGWQAWLELQENPGLKTLLRLARAADAAKPIFGKVPVFAAEKILRGAYAEVLMDDLQVLRDYCARETSSDESASVVRALETIPFLAPSAALGDFLDTTRKCFSSLGWTQHWSELERLTRLWSDRLNQTFPKRIYLRWLREVLGRPAVSRADEGSHPYSRVHLLTYNEAESQSWSHLLFAGLNEEFWPAVDDESGFVRDDDIDEFNQRNRILNRRAVRQGRQGEGQWSVEEDRTLLLGSRERRQLALRRLLNLVETATVGIGASANLYSESFPSRTANPSEFFSRLYFAARGEGVSQETMRLLQFETSAWLKNWSPVDAQKVDSINVGRTRYAYDARRQLRPAGEYEFALRASPPPPLSLRVTQWEQAMRWPALVWMKVMLGVESEDESGDGWAIATGQWVHRWLAAGAQGAPGEEFVPTSEIENIRARILEEARRFLADMQALGRKSGRALPDWWTSGWSNALHIADCLAAKLAELSDWTHLATERALGSPAVVPLGQDGALRLRGRIDLILARGPRSGPPLYYPDLWVVDYKTGRQRGFSLREMRKSESPEEKLRKQLVDGRGVQLSLYALTVHALGASDVRLTLLSPAGDLDPQFALPHVLAQQPFWKELLRMQETGVFGMLGPVHSEFGIVRAYPLATLAVDPDLLQEKWELTHPAFAVEKNGDAQT
jgi:hypothetical protein